MDCYFVSDLHIDSWLPDLTPGSKRSASYHKWMDSNLLPADILCIAGDVADNSRVFSDFMIACRNRYKYVVYVYGNHDVGVFDNEYESSSLKIEAMNTWVENFGQLCTSAHKIKTKFFRLDGNQPVDVGDCSFAGAMGAPDWSYAKTVLGSTDKAFKKLWKVGLEKSGWINWWSNDLFEIAADEKARLKRAVELEVPNVVVSHYVPLGMPAPKQYARKKLTGLFYWDVNDIINMLPSGTIWHYGHTHVANKMERNGVLYLSNPIGLPGQNVNLLGDFKKEDFLITL